MAELTGQALLEAGKRSDAPEMPSTALPDQERIGKYVDGLTSKVNELNPKLAGCLETCRPIIILPIQLIMCLSPFYFWAYKWAFIIYETLPTNAVQAIFGLALCFFGGTYVASIAAIEAFRQMGFAKVLDDLKVVGAEYQKVTAANAKDDAEDKDGDGIADVLQIKTSEFTQRKMFMAMRAIPEPARLQSAVGSLWTAYIAVLATLKLEFARTTAFALGIVEVIKFPVVRLLSPLLVTALAAAPADMRLNPEGSKAWAISIVESLLTLIAVIFAWYLQMIISAFYSGLRGGKMFADGILQLIIDQGWTTYLPAPQPYNPDETYLDEIVGYSVAAFGFGFQLFRGFALPFPLNIIFLPLTLVEWFLRLQITFTDAGV